MWSAEKEDKETRLEILIFTSLASQLCQNIEVLVRRKGRSSRAGRDKAVVETDKREEQEGGGDSIVFVCLH